MAAQRLTWELCDERGRRVDGLHDRRPGATVGIGRNGIARSAQVTLDLSDPAGAKVTPFRSTLKAWLGDRIVFNGVIHLPRFEGGGVILSALDSWLAVQRAFTLDFPLQTQVDQSEIMARLTEHRGSGLPGIGALLGPTTLVNDASIGGLAWNNPTFAAQSDDTRADRLLALGQTTQLLVATGFGFAIPAEAEVLGIRAEIECNNGLIGSGGAHDNAIYIVKGGSVLTTQNKARALPDAYWPPSDSTVTYGADNDKWGQSWQPADINSTGFGFAVSASNAAGIAVSTAAIDVMRLSVTYRLAGQVFTSTGRPTEILRGSLPASVKRDRDYLDGKNVAEAIAELADVIDGVDFELDPLDRDDGVRAQLNTYYPRQGSDLSDSVRFEYSWGRHTAGNFGYEPGGGEIVNYYVLAGSAESTEGTGVVPARVAYQPESIAIHGIWAAFEVRQDVITDAGLKELAEAYIAENAWPQDNFTVVPVVEQGGTLFYFHRRSGALVEVPGEGYGSPPLCHPDEGYWIGDEVSLDVRKDELHLDLVGTVESITLTELAGGGVAAEPTCSPRARLASVRSFARTARIQEATFFSPGDDSDFQYPDPVEPTEPFIFDPNENIIGPGLHWFDKEGNVQDGRPKKKKHN